MAMRQATRGERFAPVKYQCPKLTLQEISTEVRQCMGTPCYACHSEGSSVFMRGIVSRNGLCVEEMRHAEDTRTFLDDVYISVSAFGSLLTRTPFELRALSHHCNPFSSSCCPLSISIVLCRFITKTYTGRGLPDAAGGGAGGGWSGGAHVTHTAYLTDGLAHDHRALESNLRPPLDMSNKGRHTGFWGVWEPVLGRAGGGGGRGRSVASTAVAGVVPDGSRTTLSRRGGVFRLVPKQREE